MKHALLFAIALVTHFVSSCQNLETSFDRQEPICAWGIRGTFHEIKGPNQSLSLLIGNEEIPLMQDQPVAYRNLEPNLWERHDIPADAILAGFGWWAGYGQTFYVRYAPPYLKVYVSEVEEQSPIPHFKMLKRIDIPKSDS